MPTIASWGNLLRQTITIEPPAGSTDLYGAETFGAPVTYRCRIVGKQQMVETAKGEDVLSRQMVYLMTPNGVHPESRVTMSTADVLSTENYAVHPPILATGRYPDETGRHHSVIFL